MHIQVVSSSVENSAHQFAATYVVNDVLAIDSGAIGFADLQRQKRIHSVVISHPHLDHIASLPIFIDNVYVDGPFCPVVYGSQHTIEALKAHLFNDVVWPDFFRLSDEESPFIRFVTLRDGHPITIENMVVTPVALNHVIPTFGFIVDDGDSAVAFVSDTGPTDLIWEKIRENDRVKAVFLEAAFPNSMAWLAEKAKHLTPQMFRDEYAKLGRSLPVVAVHIKPAFYDTVVDELQQLNLETLVISQPNTEYRF
jgi:cAMP phosphodiesterase